MADKTTSTDHAAELIAPAANLDIKALAQLAPMHRASASTFSTALMR